MNDNIEKNLKSILKKWKFPEKIVQKYDEVGIKEIFDWQAEVLNNAQVSGSGSFIYTPILKIAFSF